MPTRLARLCRRTEKRAHTPSAAAWAALSSRPRSRCVVRRGGELKLGGDVKARLFPASSPDAEPDAPIQTGAGSCTSIRKHQVAAQLRAFSASFRPMCRTSPLRACGVFETTIPVDVRRRALSRCLWLLSGVCSRKRGWRLRSGPFSQRPTSRTQAGHRASVPVWAPRTPRDLGFANLGKPLCGEAFCPLRVRRVSLSSFGAHSRCDPALLMWRSHGLGRSAPAVPNLA